MRGAVATRFTIALLLFALAQCAQAAALTVLVEPYPPFVTEAAGGKLSGPYIDAFAQLAHRRGVEPAIQSMPVRRALLMAQKAPGTCVLAINYSAADAEVLLYLGRITPIYVWAYARHGDGTRASSLADLKQYSVGLSDIAEVRQMMDAASLHYDVLQQSTRGLQMLQARRFDILVSDIGPELAAKSAGASLDRLFTVARVERWLACNPNTDPATLAALHAALKEGLFAEDVRDVWSKYGMADYFAQVRKEWSATAKP